MNLEKMIRQYKENRKAVIETYSDLTIVKYEIEDRFHLAIHKGASINPSVKFYYDSDERRRESIEHYKKTIAKPIEVKNNIGPGVSSPDNKLEVAETEQDDSKKESRSGDKK